MNSNANLSKLLNGATFLTDGSLETSLTFIEGIQLPHFAAFPLLRDHDGQRYLAHYFAPYLELALEREVGFILDTPTWRANPDWGARLGFDANALDDINRKAVAWALAVRRTFATEKTPILVEGVVGPRGDGYRAEARMRPEEAERYHRPQIAALSGAGADMVAAFTMTYPEEAAGIVQAAAAEGVPVVISFTLETDGRLASGDGLGEAITFVDEETDGAAAYFMINCAHPSHFETVLDETQPWMQRLRGLRANASMRSHTELDAASELDSGDALDLALRYRALRHRFAHLSVLGGCCGTDARHMRAICEACLPV